MTRIAKSVCSHDCPDACGVLIEIDGAPGAERAVAFRGDPEHPFTRGFLCGKVHRYAEVVHSPERLLYPLRRTGPKGSGQFEKVSWDEALSLAAERFLAARARSGGESLLLYYYAGTMGAVHRFAGDAVFHRLGATRQRANICHHGADEGYRVVLGEGYGVDPEDSVHSDVIVIWGANIATTNVHLVPFFDEARRRGAHRVTIDPYRNRTARSSDEWIAVRPGTDAALALGLMQVIASEGLEDRGFIAERTLGWDELARDVLPRFTPDRVARITGVPRESIITLARRIARARAPLFRVGIALGRSARGATAVRAVCALAGSVGAWKSLGGGVLFDTGWEFRFALEPLTRPDWLEKPTRVMNQTELGPALTEWQEPRIEALWVHGSNPLATCPLQDVVRRGLAREDLFTVVHDRFLTDTARYADLVLPAPTFAETSDLYKAYGHLYLRFSRRAMKPLGESRANLDVFQAFGRACGLDGDAWFDRDVEGFVREIMARSTHPNFRSVDFDALLGGETIRLAVPRGESGFAERFATPSGKLEFRSAELEPLGHALLDFREEAEDADDLDGEAPDRAPVVYPLRLVSPPAHSFLKSSFGVLERARNHEGREPSLLIHPDDAAAACVKDGEEAIVESAQGCVHMLVRVTTDVTAGAAVAEGIWWPSSSRDGRGINVLTSNRLSDLGGGSAFHGEPVRVHPADIEREPEPLR